VRQADLEIDIPTEPGGPRTLYRAWAEQQNEHFLKLLNYYPDESFFQYALLQSRSRYGVTPPRFDKPRPSRAEVEASLYDLMTGSLAIHEALQQQVLEGGTRQGDLDVHVSELRAPALPSLDYRKFLDEKAARKILPRPHDIARFVPEDQYFLHFHSMKSATELRDLANGWSGDLLRMFAVRAQDNRLPEKLEEQLCLRRDGLLKLFSDDVATELAITGSDPFLLEGTDVTLLFRVKQPEAFRGATRQWQELARKSHPDLIERTFNYRGHKVAAHYTEDRLVSSFVVEQGGYFVFSNSHRAIRQVIDTLTGKSRSLADAADYRAATILLPPGTEANAGYFFASEAFLRRLLSPASRISERRRVLCFNNLVMLNNASLFYRLEHGKSPDSLSALVEGRFVDSGRVVCPHGGAYSWDTRHDTCTCSLHNRLRYLTPNAELLVLKVSRTEQEEYNRYRNAYEQFWVKAYDPIAARITVGQRVRLELCIAPLAADSLYQELRGWVDQAQPIDARRIAKSAVVSVVAARGRKAIGELLRSIPGVAEAIQADPTLTDLNWLGDSLALHYCDGDKILEFDPARFQELDLPIGGKVSALQQILAGAALTATEVPIYATVDVEDREKAARLLDQLTEKIPLQKGRLLTLTTSLDAYRLPDYKKHTLYVLSFRLHALKVRLHLALVGNQLVASTKAHILREVIDSTASAPAGEPVKAHLLLRLNAKALDRLQDNLRQSWLEKSRLACHHNAISIYNLVKLNEVPLTEVPRLAEAKYGVRYFCPEHGTYEYDDKRDQVVCSVHGNRQDSRYYPRGGRKSSFEEFVEGLDEVVVRLRFEGNALYTTVDIVRVAPLKGP
jgi:hypothetical protein